MSDHALVSDHRAEAGGNEARPAGGVTGAPVRRPSVWGLLLDLALIALIAVGVYFRFSGLNWHEGTNLHPDEYGLTGTLTSLRIPDSLGDYFNTRLSPISPYQKYDEFGNPTEQGPDNRMRWGQWPIIVIRFLAEATGNTGYDELRVMGRRVSALADTLALGVTFLVGWHLYGRRVGLLAAALSALAVMQIQQSHFMTADNLAVLFTMGAMYAAVRAAGFGWRTRAAEAGLTTKDEGRRTNEPPSSLVDRPSSWIWYVLFGVFFGMALASRINLAPLFAEIAVAALVAYAPQWGKRDWLAVAVGAGTRVALAGVVGFLAFRVFQPMTFRAETGDTTIFTLNPNPEWVESMRVAQAESSGEGGGPPGEQWTARPALVFPWINMVVWGLGLPLGLAAWAGLGWAAWRAGFGAEDEHWRRHLLPLTWAGGYFAFMGTRWVKSVRYFLPIYPFMALFAAWAIVELWRLGSARRAGLVNRGTRGNEGSGGTANSSAGTVVSQPSSQVSRGSRRSLLRWASAALGAVVLLGTLAWAWGFTSIYRNRNTRIQATLWAYQNIPAGVNLQVDTAEGVRNEPLAVPFGQSIGTAPYAIPFSAPVTGTVSGVSVGYARAPFDPQGRATLHVTLARDPAGAEPLAQGDLQVAATGLEPGGDPRGTPVSTTLGPAEVVGGQTYYLVLQTVQGGPVEVHGSTVTNEVWDEGLPVPFAGRNPFGGLYRGIDLPVTALDNAEKRQALINALAEADYVILPSQRRIWSSSRLPNTYPLLMEYYRALFDGRLGFELAAQFQSPITLGPLQISDAAGTWAWGEPPPNPPPGDDFPFNFNPLAAEEAFSVYDHAPVWIFRKRADFDLNQAARVLNAVDLSQVVVQGPREATRTWRLMQLPPERLAEQTAGGTWNEIFNFNSPLNSFQPLGVVVWYLAILVMAWLAWPLTYAAFGGLADRGYPLARTVALLAATWLVWVWGSYRLLPFTRGTIALGFLLVGLISAVLFWRRRGEMLAYLREHRRHILLVEGLALALFAFDLLIRLGNPDLWHWYFGGEKPMVFSFWNAVLKSTSFPPYNPWLAGHYLNYYYYGFVVISLPTKLLGIVPAFAYNLVLPTLFSMAGINAFSVAYNLVAATKKGRELGGTRATGEAALQPAVPAVSGDGAPSATGVAGDNGWQPHPVGEAPAAPPAPALAELGAPAPAAVPAATSPAVAWQDAPGEAPADPPANRPGLAGPLVGPATATATAKANHQLTITNYHACLGGVIAALLFVVLGNLGQIYMLAQAFRNVADHEALAQSFLGDTPTTALINGVWRVATGADQLRIAPGTWYWDASRVVDYTNAEGSGSEITEFPFFTFLYADMHAHMIDLPFTVLALAWAVSYLLGARARRPRLEWLAVWAIGGLALGMTRPTNTWDFPLFLALGVVAVAAGELLGAYQRRENPLARRRLVGTALRVALLAGLALLLYRPFDEWFAAAYSEVERWEGVKASLNGYLYVHGLFLFILASFLAWETRRWLAETPATVLTTAGEWLPLGVILLLAVIIGVYALNVLDVPIGLIALPLMAWAGLLLLRGWGDLALPKRVVLFLLGTALAVTLFVELYALENDRMNTIFKFYIQVWVLLSVAAGAALAWLWASLPEWRPNWRAGWVGALALLFAGAALYTVTATGAKVRDRFNTRAAQPESDCAPIPGMILPYTEGLSPERQPYTLYGLEYMKYGAYCDRGYFLPLAYDYEVIRWLQDNVAGSPVIVEAQTFDLYRMGNRIAWNTGLPNVVGWDWHTRQHNAAIPTGFITERGTEVTEFYTTTDTAQALRFLDKYDAAYVIVGPMEQAFYQSSGGLAKFDALVAQGALELAYQNPGATIYRVRQAATASQ